jgi:succinate dehydrogenase/fumarate reductase cytochrome b subunit (b558 family)
VSDSSSEKSLFDKSRRPYLMRKLHSLSGIVPVGAFMCFHLWENARALGGRDQFDAAVGEINHMPYLPFLEWGLILLPLLFHAGYGVVLMFDAKFNVGRYAYNRNWMYTLQRITGAIALLFIGFHLTEYWGRKLTGALAPQDFYPALCQNMSSTIGPVPVVALIYVVGIAACVFHFANGLWGFCFSWGIVVSRRTQRMAAAVFGVVGLVVLLLGELTAIYFATGWRLPLLGSAAGSSRTCADIAYAAPSGVGR